MNTEINDSYDDYDSDYDDGITEGFDESPTAVATERTSDEVSAVADILLGGDGDGYQPKKNDSGTRTRDLDKHGNPDYGTEDKGDKSWQSKYKSNQRSYANDPSGQHQQAVNAQSQIMDAAKTLQERFDAGLVNSADYQAQMTQLSYNNQQAQIAQLTAERDAAAFASQMSQSHDYLMNKHPEWKKDRAGTQRRAVEFACEKFGFSVADFGGVTDPRLVDALVTLQKMDTDLKEANLKIKKYRSEHRKRNKSLKQGGRDSSLGARGNSRGLDSQVDEVTRILLAK